MRKKSMMKKRWEEEDDGLEEMDRFIMVLENVDDFVFIWD
jgi:hypothetical protein